MADQMPEVMAVHAWPSNAHMLADLARIMPYITGPSVDLTHGAGAWFNAIHPALPGMVRCVGPDTEDPAPHDLVTDFRSTPFPDETFATTFYDPPYVLRGSDSASTAAMASRYGINVAQTRTRKGKTRKEALAGLIVDGLTEAARITRPGGRVYTKGGRGIDGGSMFSTDDLIVRHGLSLGLVETCSLWLVNRPRSQAHRGPQRSPRSNVSRLTVFERPI